MTTAATQDRACSTNLMNKGDEAIKRLATSAYVQVFGCRDAEILPSLGQPASEKRQGTKSRDVGHRQYSQRYGDLASA